MWPLENAIQQLTNVPPALVGALGFGTYMTCQSHCEEECPYPGGRRRPAGAPPEELERVDADDTSVLHRLLGGRRGSGGGGGGGFAGALSDFFKLA